MVPYPTISVDAQRQAVIAEARTWLRTPHHNGACIKGHGVDCGWLPLAVYHECGLMPKVDPGRYSPQFMLHRDEEWYLQIADRHGKRIAGPPLPGDFALYKIGRIFSHGAIVIEWPRIIHAYLGIGVCEDLGDQGHLKDREVIFFTFEHWE